MESRRMKYVGKAVHLDEKKYFCAILAGKSEEKTEFNKG